VKNIVLTASIFDAFAKQSGGPPGLNMEKFWLHSIGCGAASLAIAKRIGFKEKEECFIAGLIHDIGKIILYYYFPEQFDEVFNNAHSKGILFLESEKEIGDITHQEIGAIITRRWNLPENLQHIVNYHHNPSASAQHYAMTSIVHIGDILTRAMNIGNGGDDRIPVVSDVAWKDLGFEHMALGPLLTSIDDEFDKATIFMQIV
jgi:putative nucleotidyltransferase with HDIG domain